MNEELDMPIVDPEVECQRDTCSNEADWSDGYCSKECWRVDNPVKSGLID